jgi:hypothetical protein
MWPTLRQTMNAAASLRERLRSTRDARLRSAAPAGKLSSAKAEQFTERLLHPQGTYTQRFNRRHRWSGHSFQGRYKALPVEDAREGDDGCAAVFGRLQLPDEGAGSRRRYAAWMMRRVRETVEEVETPDQVARWRALQRGWYVGSESFRDRLMDLASEAIHGRKRRSYEKPALRSHDDHEATRLLVAGLARLGLSKAEMGSLRQSDPRKQGLAWLLKSRTVVDDEWICRHLQMGDRSNVSRAVAAYRLLKDRDRARIHSLLHVCTD